MRADCTIADGEAAPRNPGKPAPPGDSLYARLGGVYPIALFADRLVDALLSDTTAKISVDGERMRSWRGCVLPLLPGRACPPPVARR